MDGPGAPARCRSNVVDAVAPVARSGHAGMTGDGRRSQQASGRPISPRQTSIGGQRRSRPRRMLVAGPAFAPIIAGGGGQTILACERRPGWPLRSAVVAAGRSTATGWELHDDSRDAMPRGGQRDRLLDVRAGPHPGIVVVRAWRIGGDLERGPPGRGSCRQVELGARRPDRPGLSTSCARSKRVQRVGRDRDARDGRDLLDRRNAVAVDERAAHAAPVVVTRLKLAAPLERTRRPPSAQHRQPDRPSRFARSFSWSDSTRFTLADVARAMPSADRHSSRRIRISARSHAIIQRDRPELNEDTPANPRPCGIAVECSEHDSQLAGGFEPQ